MHFVKRSPCPQILEENQAAWTEPWMTHYAQKIPYQNTKKPTTNYWLKDDIRLVLITDFHQNCGHCGVNITKPKNENKNNVDKGDVDHFLPKSQFPKEIYNWHNYIWSCKSCNQSKRETYPLLNPCSEADCQQLIFIEDTGQYVLNDSAKNWQSKFSNSEKTTLLNAEGTVKKRKLVISQLKGRFKSINNVMPIRNMPIIEAQITDDLNEIKELKDNPDFYFLIQIQYQKLILKYPQVKNLLD